VSPARHVAALCVAASCLVLAACSTPPQGPGLLSAAEIAQATQGTTAQPDNAPLQGRAAALSARADALRRGGPRTMSDAERVRRLREARREAEREAELAALQDWPPDTAPPVTDSSPRRVLE